MIEDFFREIPWAGIAGFVAVLSVVLANIPKVRIRMEKWSRSFLGLDVLEAKNDAAHKMLGEVLEAHINQPAHPNMEERLRAHEADSSAHHPKRSE